MLSSHEHDWTYQGNHKQFAYASFAYSDPYCHGSLAAYGQHPMVHPQMLGTISGRVPLPLEYQQNEPIFANAKQYQAILRRREYLAMLDAQNKLSKARKVRVPNGSAGVLPWFNQVSSQKNYFQPYLHESRHCHALNRARGPVGASSV